MQIRVLEFACESILYQEHGIFVFAGANPRIRRTLQISQKLLNIFPVSRPFEESLRHLKQKKILKNLPFFQ